MISCGQYDYIEIACMHHYPVTLFLSTEEVVQGIALDTKRNEMKKECVLVDADGIHVLVLLDTIQKMLINIDNPHFKEVVFSE
ncbi:Rho-binding antiterminator [Marinomonas sp. 15G1-11]|uniref:Rho-binding antiterminator n=1 Tax=Marinomonas phaeophyticola TaxID=3004091 RepID=A0ABT4JSW1_9GAMM|nr:Rho-binding antiterminator [Marinomonas sp. 15G1-11]MCZ2721482.1 Rho-binding antiterminator [Marinomonas sp. 15G1-11]